MGFEDANNIDNSNRITDVEIDPADDPYKLGSLVEKLQGTPGASEMLEYLGRLDSDNRNLLEGVFNMKGEGYWGLFDPADTEQYATLKEILRDMYRAQEDGANYEVKKAISARFEALTETL